MVMAVFGETLDETAYYHGGRSGLLRGGLVLPQTRTGVRARAERHERNRRPDRVHLASGLHGFKTAYLYAEAYSRFANSPACVYAVEPLPAAEEDPLEVDCWHAAEARILRVIAVDPSLVRVTGVRGQQ